jgi:hypothetical protein
LQVAINAGVDFPYLLHKMIKEGDIEKSLTYQTGIRCRYLLFNDLFRIIKFLGGNYSFKEKQNAVKDFLSFQEDGGYYVYSSDDMKPLAGLAYIKMLKKFKVTK